MWHSEFGEKGFFNSVLPVAIVNYRWQWIFGMIPAACKRAYFIRRNVINKLKCNIKMLALYFNIHKRKQNAAERAEIHSPSILHRLNPQKKSLMNQ
jgi:hypothetical protein